MRRFAAFGASVLLCASCSQATLTPEEVFGRSMSAIRDFSSAQFTVHARSELNGAPAWRADLDGTMASGGKQLSFDADLSMRTGAAEDASFKGSMLIPAEGEVYVKADSVALGQGTAPFLGALTGTWWKLPETGSGSSDAALTPDPSLLSMQLETVTLTKDRGTERINQRVAYKYDVTMDRAKLLSYVERTEGERGGDFDRDEWETYLSLRDINGTVWIDTETFLPDKIEWTIVSRDPDQPGTVSFDVTFRDHNEPVSIVPPASSSPFPLGTGDLQKLLAPSAGSGATDMPFPSLP